METDPRAVLLRPAPAPDLVLRYGPADDHLIDVYLPPPGHGPAPLIVLLHGGFWRQAFDRRHVRPMADALRDAGYAVAAPEYARTGGRGGWPTTFTDLDTVRGSLPRMLAETAPGRIAGEYAVCGHSAGGHLAMWWALTATDNVPARVVALAPVADLGRAYADALDGGAPDDSAVGALMGGGPDDHPDRYAAVDPARLLRERDSAPITVIHGDQDDRVPVAHSRDLIGVRLVVLPGIDHFAVIDPLSTAWPTVLAAVSAASSPPVS